MNKPIFIFCLLLIISCNTHNTLKKNNIAVDTILDSQNIFDTTFKMNSVDTFDYSNFPFWDSTMDRYESAYIDTFSVDNNNFRFVSPTNNTKVTSNAYSNVYLEKYLNNKWIYTGFAFSGGNHIGNFHHSRDVNGDGFIDITQTQRFKQTVYFYNSKNKNYDFDTTNEEKEDYINPEWELIDTSKKIFCDFQGLKGMCGQIHSQLYTYNGTARQNLYDLELYNCTETNDDVHLVTKLVLTKVVERKYYDLREMDSKDSLIYPKDIQLNTPIDLDKDYDSKVGYFDFVKFWKEHYRGLLGYN